MPHKKKKSRFTCSFALFLADLRPLSELTCWFSLQLNMPQDKLRSAVYRSFVTCDDPKGVVECGTIRKSKSSPKTSEDNAKSRKMPNNLNSSSAAAYKEVGKEMVHEKDTEDFHNPSSFQLMEVSKGAQKLNQVIDSWSKGVSFDGNSKEIAKDLLKGALDLQESLIMLGKLQEASQYMAKLKKKQKEKSRGERIDQVGIERTQSLHLTDQNFCGGFQKPRLSADGYSRECFGEQKEKSRGERIHDLGIERTSSHRFTDHNYQKLSADWSSRDWCGEQKEKSRGERIDDLGIERGERIDDLGIERRNSHRFTDHNHRVGYQKPRLSVDGSTRDCFDELRTAIRDSLADAGIGRTNSDRFTDYNYQMGYQKPSLSVDGSSRDCFDELRTAIRDSLARQNLLPLSCGERKAFCDKRALDTAHDIASTSSSQSSMGNFHESASYDSSVSSKASKAPNKSKGSNLIAKLMGLEEIPLQAVHTAPQKQVESEKISSPRRAVFDIDMPKARKPQSAARKAEAEQVKLKEIVETTQFKGLLKNNSAEGLALQFPHSNASESKRRFAEDAPPIVIMKPRHFSSKEANEPHLQTFIRDMESLNTGVVLRKFNIREVQPQITDHEKGALKSSEMGRRVKGDETPIKRLSQEGDETPEVVQAKLEVAAVKTNGKLPSKKVKASVLVNQQQRKKTVEKKVESIQKVTPRRKKPAEVENVTSIAVTKSHDQAKVTSTKERKPEIGSIITKRSTSPQKPTSSSIISKHTTPSISHDCGDRKKNSNNGKPVKDPLAANLVVENKNVGCKVGNKLIDLHCEHEAHMAGISTATADQVLSKEGTDTSETQIEDPCDISHNSSAEQCDSGQNSVCKVIQQRQNTQQETFVKSAEETKHCISQNLTKTKCFRTETNAKYLFLSSPAFLNYAEELFDVTPNRAIALPTTGLNTPGTDDTSLLLDCAYELIHQKSLRCTQTIHPSLLTPVRSSNISVSLAQLVEEVCNGIENLRSYSKNSAEKLPKDSLSVVLERDLRCREVVTAGWDLGWRHLFTMDEVEKVVGDIEKLVFTGLIEDMFADFIL